MRFCMRFYLCVDSTPFHCVLNVFYGSSNLQETGIAAGGYWVFWVLFCRNPPLCMCCLPVFLAHDGYWQLDNVHGLPVFSTDSTAGI